MSKEDTFIFLITQLSLVKKYHNDSLSTVQIFDILKEIFEDDAIPYSTITYHVRRESWIDPAESDKKRRKTSILSY